MQESFFFFFSPLSWFLPNPFARAHPSRRVPSLVHSKSNYCVSQCTGELEHEVLQNLKRYPYISTVYNRKGKKNRVELLSRPHRAYSTATTPGQLRPTPRFKLVSFDLDGTLLNSQHTFSERSQRMICMLHKKGVHIVFASGRTYTVLRRQLASLPMFQGPQAIDLSASNDARIFCAGSNGACVYDEEGTCLQDSTIHPDMCSALYKVHASYLPEVNMNVYLTVRPEDRAAPDYENPSDRGPGDLATDEWVSCAYDRREASVMRSADFIQKVIPNAPEVLKTTGVTEVFFVCCDADKMKALTTSLQEAIDVVDQATGNDPQRSVKLCAAPPHCVVVAPVTLNKAVALHFIADHLGLSFSECVAFGDGMNDVEVLRELKAALADLEVIGTNDEDAVAATVEELFQLAREGGGGIDHTLPFREAVLDQVPLHPLLSTISFSLLTHRRVAEEKDFLYHQNNIKTFI
eukprot:gene6359-4584_t